MTIRTALYGNVDVWVWLLVALVAALAVSVWWALAFAGRAARERDQAVAELRRQNQERAKNRAPAKTIVLPALPPIVDPEEFRKTQVL